MLKGYKILTSFCVICATLYGGAYGAASVRGGATSRAGSIRTFGAGTTASVKTTAARPQPTTTAANANTESTESVGGMRMSHATGLGGSKLPGKISGTTTSTSGDNQNVAELRQAIEQLRNDYDALGEQYNNLLGDVSNVSDTAQVAHDVAANNANTLTVVRTDLSVAQSDIEDLKANGGFDEERVQEALDTTLAQKNYATRGELAATDAVARGAVQVADLPQRLNALNVADKDYVASQALGAVNDSLNITLENYYTKGQVNDAIELAKMGMIDKDYVDNQVRGLVPKAYVDSKISNLDIGVDENQVQGIVNDSINLRLGNYYTKGDIDDAMIGVIDAAKDGMVDKDYVDNQVRGLASTDYVNEKVAEVEGGVDTGTLYNILETRGYKTGSEVRDIVDNSLYENMANYYTKGQVDNLVDSAKTDMVDKDYVDNQVRGLAPKNWVSGQIDTVVDTKIAALPLGLDRDAVKGVVEEYEYKTENDVRNIVTGYNYATVAEIPDMVNQWAPGAELQYADGKLYFVDKDGNDRVVDIRGLDGQDGAQVELRKDSGEIQWRYASGDDQSWHQLIKTSELEGAAGKSVELDVVNDNLVWKKEGETGWQYLYDLSDINGIDGCGVKASTTNTANGTMVQLLRDCNAEKSGNGQLLAEFEVTNGADGTVTEEQIVEALESNPSFLQLKNKVNNLENVQGDTHNLVVDVYDAVNNETTGLVATNRLANKAWNKVEDLETTNATAREYVDNRIGNLGFNLSTYKEFESVAAKLGAIDGTKTVKEYVDTAVAGINTNIKVRQGRDGYTYICKTGNNCTGEPDVYSDDWARISVDVSGYLTQSDANGLYAPIGLVSAVDTAQSAATQAQTQAAQAWGKLEGLGNLTVKGYVDDYFDDTIGFLGTNLLSGKNYSVADKIGIYGNDTVKKYIDDAIAGVNTKIQVAQGVDGRTYICKNGNTCTTGYPSMYSDEWVPITVDMSGYLTQNDADNRYATISTLNEVKTTANEAKTAATAAQQTATQAQSTATAAQSTANDAWGKLSGLSGTVKDYVDDKVGATGLAIRVETGTDGYTYICTASNSDCRDGPSQSSSYWKKIDFTIPSEYLTETEGNAWYAPKAEYALKSDIGTLGGTFSSVADKIGLNNSNDWTNSNKSVKQYVDDKFSSISTDIQVETGTDGFTYICKTGSGCTGEPSQNPSQWTKVNVDLGNLGTNLQTGQAYNVAQKIGLTDAANLNKTVVGYIGEQIGSLGYTTNQWGQTTPHSVLTYMQANYTPLTKLGTDITSDASKTVVDYISAKIGALGGYYDSSYNLIPYTSVKQYVDSNFALKSTIGDLGASYTVAQKIGLVDSNASKTVKQYVDDAIGSLGGSYTSVAGKLGSAITNGSQTVADYIATQLSTVSTSVIVRPSSNGNDTYICTGTNCTSHYNDPENDSANWTKLNVDLTSINTILSGFGSGEDKIPTVKGYVDDKIGTLGKVNASNNATSVAEKLGTDITGAEKTVAQYIYDKIGGLGGYNNGSYDVYYNVASKIGEIGSTQTVKGYVDSALSGLSSTYAAKSTEDTANNAWDRVKSLGKDVNGYDYTTVAGRLGFDTSANSKTVKAYVDDKIGSLGNTATDTPATSVADKLGTAIINANKTVAKYIEDYVTNNMSSGGVQVMTVDIGGGVKKTYICSDNCDTNPPCTYPTVCGWQELDIDISSKAEQSDMTAVQNILAGFGGENEPETVMNYIGDMGNYQSGWQDVPYTVASKIGLNSGDDAKKSVKQYIADRLGFTGDDLNSTVADYVAAHAAGGNVQVKTVESDTYICSDNCDVAGTPPCAAGTYPDTCGWQKLEISFNGYATEEYVDDAVDDINDEISELQTTVNDKADKSMLDDYALKTDIGTLGTPSGSETPYTVQTKIGAIPAAQTIKDYIDTNMPSIDVRPGSSEPNKNKLYICTKPNCGDDVPGNNDSGWVELDIASAIELSVYLKTADLPTQLGQTAEVNAIKSAVSTELDNKLNKSNIELKREDDKIMISGGGISTPYEVAKVSDFMCASYRMEEIGSDDLAYQAGKTSFRLVCETVSEDDND